MMLLLAAIGAAVAVFLLVIILLGKTRSSSGVQQRLGTLSDDGKSKGVFGRFRFLRKAARSAESAAADRLHFLKLRDTYACGQERTVFSAPMGPSHTSPGQRPGYG